MSKLIVQGVKSERKISETVKKVFLEATDNLKWLKRGDKVLLKPAVNSFYPYPSTTHPGTVNAIGELLEKRGAKVIIGDMPGLRHLLLDKEGIKKGSSQDIFKKAGYLKGSKLKYVGFEEGGWKDFYKFKTKNTKSWKDGFYVTNWIKKVDHIINLPRLSTHSQAGVTLGFKNLVGLLRADSRMEFHADGPYNSFIKMATLGSKLHKQGKGKDKFWEKMTEIYLAVKKKMRLTLITATKAQITFGPDKYSFSTGMAKLSQAHQVKPDTGLVFASKDPIATEVFGIAFLTHLYPQAPLYRKILQDYLVKINGQIKGLGKEDVWHNRFVKHALKLGLGKNHFEIDYKNVPEELQREINKFIWR